MIKKLFSKCYQYQLKNNGNREQDFPVISKEWHIFFKEAFLKHKFPSSSNHVLVIVETREDPRLAFAVSNISYYIPNWQLHIFHSKDNEAYVKTLLGEQVNNVVLHQLETSIHSPKEYNDLLLNYDFWHSLSAYNKALIFQSDSFMLQSGIEKFLKYDYIGSPWKWWKKEFKDSKRMGGNGGFSLRNIAKMKETILKYKDSNPPNIPDYYNEDVFFSYHLYYDKEAVLPDFNAALLFASETILCKKSMAVHQTWRFFKGFSPKFIIRE